MDLKQVTNMELANEVRLRLSHKDATSKEINARAVDVETALSLLVKRKKPLPEDYKGAEKFLREHQQHLRDPSLYDRIRQLADVAGSTYVESRKGQV